MIGKITAQFSKYVVIALALMFLALPYSVQAQSSAVCEGVQVAGGALDCKDKKLSDDQFGKAVRTVINILSVIVGAVSVIMIIIGGFRYVISAGDSNAVSGAKNTILYAIVGLVIVLFAQIIVRFVITNVSK